MLCKVSPPPTFANVVKMVHLYHKKFSWTRPLSSQFFVKTVPLRFYKFSRKFYSAYAKFLETLHLSLQKASTRSIWVCKLTRHAPPIFTIFFDTLHLRSQNISTHSTCVCKICMDHASLCLQTFSTCSFFLKKCVSLLNRLMFVVKFSFHYGWHHVSYDIILKSCVQFFLQHTDL